jgi:quinoprotein glucose dehydrogenase
VNTGDIAWQVPFGTVDGTPAGLKTGGPNSGGGPISTGGGLVFIGATRDKKFHAFDARTGEELWSTQLAEAGLAVPITWQTPGGHQYVALAAGSKLIVFHLPEAK